MKVLGAAEVLTPFEMEQIIETAMRILAEVGVQIPNPRVLSVFAPAETGVTARYTHELWQARHDLRSRFARRCPALLRARTGAAAGRIRGQIAAPENFAPLARKVCRSVKNLDGSLS